MDASEVISRLIIIICHKMVFIFSYKNPSLGQNQKRNTDTVCVGFISILSAGKS